MSYQLVIAEKSSVAQSIAKVLEVTNKKDGYLEGNNYLISWCIGHLISLANAELYDEKYSKWSKDDLPILPDNWIYEVSPGKSKQFRVLKELMNRKDVSELICATDAGREGELIFRQVYEKAGCHKPFKRLWISSMEDKAIRCGFSSLRPGTDYDNLYASALARAKADWLVGINGTRLYSSLYGTLLRVGRVQTPVLSMLVERDHAIRSFQKTPYWNVHLSCGGLTLHKEKIFDQAQATALLNQCQGQNIQITSVQTTRKSIAPPRLYDLTTLQREANCFFGYTAQQVLDTIQSLYEKKLCTYPRTDSQFLTEDMLDTATQLIFLCVHILPFASGYSYQPDVSRVINNKKVTDHHAIIPTEEITKADLSQLSEIERNILYQIGMRFLCATSVRHLYQETLISASCGDEIFTTKGKVIQENGWKTLEQRFRSSLHADQEEPTQKDPPLPEVQEGERFSDAHITVSSHFTTPPKPYTEDTLLSAMETAGDEDFDANTEKKGLGTPATRAGILEKLVSSGYIKRKGKSLIPTEDGINLAAVMPETLKSPKMTAEWENTLMQIERGEVTDTTFLDGIEQMVKKLVNTHTSLSDEERHRFPAFPDKEILGDCPWCHSPVHEGKSNYYCSNRECSFCLWKNSTYLSNLKKPMTQKMAMDFLKARRIHGKGLYSVKTGKTFDADIVLTDSTDKNGKRIPSFQLEFQNTKKK